MKKLLIALTLLLLPCSAWSAAITSAQDGAWATGSTWVGGTAPSDGDTAIIATGHDVTVGTNITVGTDGATGTEAIQVQGTGTLTVQSGYTLTVKGDLNQQRGTTVTVSGTLVLDATTGVVYLWKALNSGSGVANLRMSGASASSRALFTVGPRGGVARFETNADSFFYADIRFANAILSGLGTSSMTAMDNYMFVDGAHNDQTNVAWVGCGKVIITARSGDNIVDWNGVDFRGALSYTALDISSSAAKTTGTRELENITLYPSPSVTNEFIVTMKDLTINGMILYNTAFLTAANLQNATLLNIFNAADMPVDFLIGIGLSNNTLKDHISLQHYDNQHHLSEGNASNSLAANVFDGIICDGDNYVNLDAGDCIIPAREATVKNSLVINKAGTLVSLIFSSASANLINNTSTGAFHVSVGESQGAATQLGVVRNNLWASQGAGIRQLSAFVTQTGLTLENNAYWDMTLASNIDYGGNNTYFGEATYNPWWAAGSYGDAGKGADDVYANPQFVDPTRTVRGYGSWASVQAAAREMVSINGIDYSGAVTTATTKTVPGIHAWIRAGFAPTNVALATAGYGGTYIGAVEPVASATGSALLMGW